MAGSEGRFKDLNIRRLVVDMMYDTILASGWLKTHKSHFTGQNLVINDAFACCILAGNYDCYCGLAAPLHPYAVYLVYW